MRLRGVSAIWKRLFSPYSIMHPSDAEMRLFPFFGLDTTGSLEMWIELLDTTTAAEIPVSKLLQPPAMEAPSSARGRVSARARECLWHVSRRLKVEIRLICWTVHDLQMRMCPDLSHALQKSDSTEEGTQLAARQKLQKPLRH